MSTFLSISHAKLVIYGLILVSVLTADHISFLVCAQSSSSGHALSPKTALQSLKTPLTPHAVSAATITTVSDASSLSPREKDTPRSKSMVDTLRGVAPSIEQSVRGILLRGKTQLPSVREIRISVPVATGIGVVLAFNSGYLNGCCLSGLLLPTDGIRQGTAAVTGAFTTSALAFAQSPQKNGVIFANTAIRSQLGVILSYFGGSCLAGLLNPNPVPFYLSPTTAPTLVMGAWLLYKATSHCDLKTLVGHSCGNNNPWVVFNLVAAVNGLQNSLTSVHTANLVRSAHFSGSASDTGTFLGQVLRGNGQNRHRIVINTALMTAFWIGSAVAFSAVQAWSVTSLVWSARLYMLLATIVLGLQLL